MTPTYFYCIRLIVFNAQASDGIENSQYHHSYICEDSNPHIGDTQRTQDQADGLDCQRKYDVLVDDTQTFAGNPHSQGNLGRIVIHQDHVCSFNGCIRTKCSHGDTDVSKAAYPKFLEKLSVCRDLFHGFDYAKFMTGSDLDKAKTISGGVNFILGKSVAEHDLPDNEKTQNVYIKEALLLRQALSLCGSLVDEKTRFEAAFFESVRTMIVRLMSGGTGKKFTLPEVNERINELLKHSIKSEGVINLFSDVQSEFSLFDPKFLEEVANMKEKNLAVELLKKLIAEQVSIYRRTNIVKSEKFSELIQGAMNRYLNGMLTNEEVIAELLKLAKEIANAAAEGEKMGLTADELAFYDALTKPQAIKDFYEHDELIAITKELTDLLRKNRTIDWQKKRERTCRYA